MALIGTRRNLNYRQGETHSVSTVKELIETIKSAKDGDILQLTAGNYELSNSIKITKNLTIQSSDPNNLANILYRGAAKTAAFGNEPQR